MGANSLKRFVKSIDIIWEWGESVSFKKESQDLFKSTHSLIKKRKGYFVVTRQRFEMTVLERAKRKYVKVA